jgi:hypothetical protein
VTFRILDESGSPLSVPTSVYKESDRSANKVPPGSCEEIFAAIMHGGQTPVEVSTAGIATMSFGAGYLCVSYDSALGPGCDDRAEEDFVSGTTRQIGICGGDQSEVITIDMIAGAQASGRHFTVEVVSIALPRIE